VYGKTLLPCAVHDLTAARVWDILRELAAPGWWCWRTRVIPAREITSVLATGTGQARLAKDANRAHTQLRGPGERANAQLKTWRILRKLRCCPWRAGQLTKAIHVVQAREADG
jgi:hypothetical protein